MFSANLGFNWQKSKAHWLLLSKFVNPRCPYDFTRTDDWKTVLGETPNKAIKRFFDSGLLTKGDLHAHLSYKYSVTELKDMLKQVGLPVSGIKEKLIERLVQKDAAGMEKNIAGLTVLICTQKGMELANQYLTSEKAKRELAEQQTMEFIRMGRYKEASMTLAAFEAEQVFSRGMNMDWEHHNPNHDIEMLNIIFSGKPKILSKLADDKLDALRLGAAMMTLWGTNMARKWLPPDFKTGLAFDNDTAARMLFFLATHRANIENYRRNNDVVEGVAILPADDACDACKSLGKKVYTLDEVPELPYENCTHRMGCRCALLPIVKGFPKSF